MQLKIAVVAASVAIALSSSVWSQDATSRPWPDVKTAIQGKFYNTTSTAVVEVVGDDIFLRQRSQYPDQPESRLQVDQRFYTIQSVEVVSPYTVALKGPLAGEDSAVGFRPDRRIDVQRAGHDGSLSLRIFGREFKRQEDLDEYDLESRSKPYPR